MRQQEKMESETRSIVHGILRLSLLLLLLSCQDKTVLCVPPLTYPKKDLSDFRLKRTSTKDEKHSKPTQKQVSSEVKPNANTLIDIKDLLPKVKLDIRYAGTNNFLQQQLYPQASCKLRKPVAEALVKVQNALAINQLQILIWDCYRPFHIQEKLWKKFPKAKYVAKPIRVNGIPSKGSRHNRGAAIDLAILKITGEKVGIPTDFDDFTSKASSRLKKNNPLHRHALLLQKAMREAGFQSIASEWWHFDYHDWSSYKLE